MATVLVQRKFSIYTNFLDTTLQLEDEMSKLETFMDAMSRLNEGLETMAAKLRVEAESMRGEIISETIQGAKRQFPLSGQPMPEAIPTISKDSDNHNETLDFIQNAPNMEALLSFKLLANNNAILYAAYCERLKELSL
jgi:hypothetical protein